MSCTSDNGFIGSGNIFQVLCILIYLLCMILFVSVWMCECAEFLNIYLKSISPCVFSFLNEVIPRLASPCYWMFLVVVTHFWNAIDVFLSVSPLYLRIFRQRFQVQFFPHSLVIYFTFPGIYLKLSE